MKVALMCQREEITWGHVWTWQRERKNQGHGLNVKELGEWKTTPRKKKKWGSFDPTAFVTSFVVEFSYFLLFPWGQMKLCERKTACSFLAKWPCWSCKEVLQKYFIHPETLTRKPSLIDESLISHSLSPCKKKKKCKLHARKQHGNYKSYNTLSSFNRHMMNRDLARGKTICLFAQFLWFIQESPAAYFSLGQRKQHLLLDGNYLSVSWMRDAVSERNF